MPLFLGGLAILYLPMFWTFAEIFWAKDEGSHTPILLAGIGYGYWRERKLFTFTPELTDVRIGLSLLAIGWLCYGFGLFQSFFQLQGVSLIPIVAGITLLAGGVAALRKLWWLNLLLIMTIPIPASLAAVILLKLRLALTGMVTDLFSALGFPIARHGVSITLGFYELKVANACAGLRSMLSLLAIGGLYIFLVPLRRTSSTILFLLSTAPLALVANFIRVSSLVLIAYYFGGTVQGAMHDIAAYTEVLVAIALFVGSRAVIERQLDGVAA